MKDAFRATQKFWQSAQEINNIVSLIERSEGEITPEIEAAYKLVTDNLSSSVDECVEIRNRLETMTNHYKTLAKPFISISRSFQRMRDEMTTTIKNYLSEKKEKTIYGELLGFQLRNTDKVVIIDDIGKIPDRFLKKEANISLIKEALKAGEKIEGAHLEENFALFSVIKKQEVDRVQKGRKKTS